MLSGTVADASAVQVPRADVYVQYVDEAGNLIPGTSKTLVLDDAKTGTAYIQRQVWTVTPIQTIHL